MSAILAVEGYMEQGAKRQVAHTAVGIRARAIADLRQLAAQFGLSPASESGLSAPAVPIDDDDPFAAARLALSTVQRDVAEPPS